MGLVLLPTRPVLGSLALTAGLFHLLNNALYKTSLFLGAGSVHLRTGTRSLNDLGGLGPIMPWTAGAERAYRRGITLDFIHAGRPVANGAIESFNDRLRDGCLNTKQPLSTEDARRKFNV